MAKNELAAIISGIFSLFIFIIIGSAVIGSLSQIGQDTSLNALITIVFLFSAVAIFIALIGAIWKIINDMSGNFF